MAIEPGQDGIGHPENGSRSRVPNGISEKVDEEGKDQGRKNIPVGNVKELLLAADGGLQQVIEDQGEGQQDGNVYRPNPFRIFPALRIPEGKGNGPGDDRQIPYRK